jgi:hypothetical protein
VFKVGANQTCCHDEKRETVQGKIHPISVSGFTGTNHELGQAIGRMRYDQVVEVLEGLKVEVSRQGVSDHKLRRYCLSGHLMMLDSDIKKVIEKFQKIFMVCRPFMTNELKKSQKSKCKK